MGQVRRQTNVACNKEFYMSKENKSRKEDKKKPLLSLKEKRAKKHDKKSKKAEHTVNE